MAYREGAGRGVFTLGPAQGERSLIPPVRRFTVEFTGFADAAGTVEVRVDGAALPAQTAWDPLRGVFSVTVADVPVQAGVEISLGLSCRREGNDAVERCFRLLDRAEVAYDQKDAIYRCITQTLPIPGLLGQLHAMGLDPDLYGALTELLTAWT